MENTRKYLSPPAELCLQDAAQGEGDGPSHCGTPGEEPQSLGQLHPFLEGELHLHHHHGGSEGVRVFTGGVGEGERQVDEGRSCLCLRERRSGKRRKDYRPRLEVQQ